MKKLLLRSFDESLTSEERQKLESALEKDPDLMQEKKRLESLRSLISGNTFRSFSSGFAEKVMRQIKRLRS